MNLTDDELLQWCLTRGEGWVILSRGQGPTKADRFSRTADAAFRFFELCRDETPYVQVVRVTDGEARFVGRAFHGAGVMLTGDGPAIRMIADCKRDLAA